MKLQRRSVLLFFALFGYVVSIAAVALVGGLALDTADTVKGQQSALQASRVEACERLNVRLDKLDRAIHTVFDPGADTPRELVALSIFDEALESEDCRKVLKP